jgi:ABC-type lipoprotein release transport system permease subunit
VFGAQPGQVVRTILLDSAVPIAIGVALGLAGAAAVTRAIQSFLFETAPTDTGTYASVAFGLVVAGCLAALVPAMRASRVDPAVTLRSE